MTSFVDHSTDCKLCQEDAEQQLHRVGFAARAGVTAAPSRSCHVGKRHIAAEAPQCRRARQGALPTKGQAPRPGRSRQLPSSGATRGPAVRKARHEPLRSKRKEHRLLKRLHAALQCLPAARRREVLSQRLSQSQRLALEQWLLEQKARATGARPEPTEGGDKVHPKKGAKPEMRSTNDEIANKTLDEEACLRLPSTTMASPRCGAGYFGIMTNRQVNGNFFRAQVNFGSVCVMSRASRSLRETFASRAVLLQLRRRTVASVTAGTSFEDGFRQAVLDTLGAAQLPGGGEGFVPGAASDAESAAEEECCSNGGRARLRFKVSCCVPLLRRHLWSRAFSLPEELDVGLRARHGLQEARLLLRAAEQRFQLASTSDEAEEAWRAVCGSFASIISEASSRPAQTTLMLELLQGKLHAMRQKLELRATTAPAKHPLSDKKRPLAAHRCQEPQRRRVEASDGHAEQEVEEAVQRWSQVQEESRAAAAAIAGTAHRRRRGADAVVCTA